MTAAAKLSDDRSKWYTQDCSKNPDGVGDVLDDSLPVPCQAGEIGREYERQKAAWKKVEQCRSDGGSDCMRYSATNTADKTDGKAAGKAAPSGISNDKGGVPLWVWFTVGGLGILVVVGGIVLAVVLSKRSKKGGSRHNVPASGRGPLPPVSPYPPQVPSVNNGMFPPTAGQYAPQQQAPYPSAFPQQQAPHPSAFPQQAPFPVPPQRATQLPVTPGNTQNPYTNNNRNNR